MSVSVEFKQVVVEFKTAAFEDQDDEQCLALLERLAEFEVTAASLRETKVGKLVNSLRKHANEDISSRCRTLVKKWKDAVGGSRKRKKVTTPSTSSSPTDSPSLQSQDSGVLSASSSAGEIEVFHKIGVAESKDDEEDSSSSSKRQRLDENGGHAAVEISLPAGYDEGGAMAAASPHSRDARAAEFANKERIINMTTGNKVRDIARRRFADALTNETDDENSKNAAKELGVAIETVMFQKFGYVNDKYKEKYRLLLSDLTDSNNPDLKDRILSNEILPPELISMGYQDLASDALKEDRRRRKKEGLDDNLASGAPPAEVTDMFKCFKCKSRKTSFYQLQTRGGDEPMTTFVTCVVCRNRWRC